MPETGVTTTTQKFRLGRFIALSVSLACSALIGSYLLLACYLRTPTAAHQASRMLTDHLQHPVTVAGLSLSGGTFSVIGLSIGSPAGFKEREIVSSRVVSLTPGWRTLLRGGKNFDKIAVEGLRITLGRNEKNEWNYSALARLLSQGKGGGETFIQRLAIADSTLAVGDFRVDNLALTVTDLSTRGTTGSRLILTCRDVGGTPVRLEGGARLGATPSLEFVLSASSFPLKNYRQFIQTWPALELAQGAGEFSLGLKLHNGKVAVQGKLALAHVVLNLRNGALPFSAELDFTGGYDSREDKAVLETCSLRLNKTVQLSASGSVRQVRTVRDFAAAVSLGETDVRELHAMLPPGLRGNLAASGTLGPADFRCSGTAATGIAAGRGTVSLSRGEVSRGGRLLARDLAAAASLVKVRAGWELLGKISQGKDADGDLLQDLKGGISALLSDRMKPLHAGTSLLSARLAGIPVQGKIGYRPGASEPVLVSLDMKKAPAAAVNRYLAGGKVTVSAGTVEFSLQASGQDPHNFRGKLRGSLAGIQGRMNRGNFAIRDGTIDADFSGSSGKLAAGGGFRCSGSLPNGTGVEAASGFRIRDREFSLSDGSVTYDRAYLRFASIQGPLPAPVRGGGISRVPLRLHLDGIAARFGDASCGGLAGDLGLDYVAGRGKQWLTGSGVLTVASLAYKGRDAGSLAGRLMFSESGMSAHLDGKILGGRLSGTANLDPFDPRGKAGFSIHLDGVHCAGLASFGPVKPPVHVSGGVLDAELVGGYTAADGVHCRLEAKGKGLTLAGKEGKTVLADGTIQTVCELMQGRLFIREGSIGLGSGVSLGVRGEVARIQTPDREGAIFVSLPTAPLTNLLATFGAAFPEWFRDISASGTAGATGTLRVANGKVMFDGEAALAQAGFEIPAQKISAADLTGTIPISLATGGSARPGKNKKLNTPRDTYATLHSALRQAAETGRTFRIGRLRFGGMELGETLLGIRAGDGLIEITSLTSEFLEGTLLGKGFFHYGKQIQYGADLALNNLSLRALCNSYPKIKGYISGKVDGTANFYGEGGRLNGLVGIFDVWTRSAPVEKMLVSKEFLQKLAGKKLKGIFFQNDRPYDNGEIRGNLENGYIVFDVLDISHTNIFGIRDLSVSVAPVQNKIEIVHLISSIKEAATRGKAVGGGESAPPAPVETEFKWQE